MGRQGDLHCLRWYEVCGRIQAWEKSWTWDSHFSDGEMWDGEFREDKPWNTTHHDKDGNIFGKYVDGKWHSAEPN